MFIKHTCEVRSYTHRLIEKFSACKDTYRHYLLKLAILLQTHQYLRIYGSISIFLRTAVYFEPHYNIDLSTMAVSCVSLLFTY